MLKPEDIIILNDEEYDKRIKVRNKLKILCIIFLVIGLLGIMAGIGLFTFAVINTYKDLDFNMILFILAPIVFFIFAIVFTIGLYYRVLFKAINNKKDEN